MRQLAFVLAISIYLSVPLCVKGTYDFYVELQSFSNPSSTDSNGDCCDIGCDSCENYFIFCLRQPGHDEDSNTCPYGSFSTGAKPVEGTYVEFNTGDDALAPFIPNPLKFGGSTWPGGFQLKIRVFDSDVAGDDFIDYFIIEVPTFVPTGEYSDFITYSGENTNGVHITLRYSLQCREDWYGQNCNINCDSSHICIDEDLSTECTFLVDCGTLSAPANGRVSDHSTTFNSTATYSCNDGYIVTGYAMRTCLESCVWSGSEPTCTGVLQLLLSGYDNVPNDNTALVAIPDIGTHAKGTALICRHHITGIPSENEIDNWNYIPESGQEVRVNSDIGWSVSRGQNEGDVRLERITGVSPLEGKYNCAVDRSSINNDEGIDSVTVYLYWPLAEIEVDIEVVSQESQQYNVSCRSMGGSVVSSSLTGPDGENLGQLLPVEGQQDLRGADNYSISVLRTGGAHGDVFMCTASTRDNTSTLRTNASLRVASSVVDITVVQVSSPTPTLNITWQTPEDGTAVTGYTVHYIKNGSGGSIDVQHNTTLLIPNLVADGQPYNIVVETHSIHLSGFTEPLQYNLCLVSELLLVSRTSHSLSLTWKRPEYYTGPIAGLIQYRVIPDGDTQWQYVIDSDDSLPPLTELTEYTSYSIEMAFIDLPHKTLCVFNAPLIAKTELGTVRSLQARAEEDGIVVSWSPPNVPSDIVVTYEVTYLSDDGLIRNTTQDHDWRIAASQGDTFSITVTPWTDDSWGDSSTLTTGVDFLWFQLRVDGIGNCDKWINADQEVKLLDVIDEVTTTLYTRCNCSTDVQRAEFLCLDHDQDFVIFRGQLFAPLTTSAEELLSNLDKWMAEGPTIKITDANINSNCRPSEAYADTCVQPAETTAHNILPTMTTTTNDISTCPTQISSATEPSYTLPITAVGCLFIGIILTLVMVLITVIGYSKLKERAKRPIMNNEFRPVDHQQQQDRGEIMNIPNPMALHLEMYEHNHAEMEEQNGDEEQNAW